MPKPARNSNIELLRIIAMMFIVVLHIMVHILKGATPGSEYIIGITVTGVNLFILISGFFGIRTTWKSFMSLMSIVIFFYAIALLLNWSIFNRPPTIGEVVTFFTPISRSTWWFVKCYLLLAIFSQFINMVLENSSKAQYGFLLGALIYISCISGFLLRNPINPDGYNLFQFITLYVIGDAIKRYNILQRVPIKMFIAIYILSTIATIFLMGIHYNARYYNNPTIIIAAVSLFCIIGKIDFKSKTVNRIAGFMFPVYLLQDSPLGFRLYRMMRETLTNLEYSDSKWWIYLSIYIIGLLATVFLFEHIRRLIFKRPIAIVCKKMESYFSK